MRTYKRSIIKLQSRELMLNCIIIFRFKLLFINSSAEQTYFNIFSVFVTLIHLRTRKKHPWHIKSTVQFGSQNGFFSPKGSCMLHKVTPRVYQRPRPHHRFPLIEKQSFSPLVEQSSISNNDNIPFFEQNST